MKIDSISIKALRFPLSKPIITNIHTLHCITALTLNILTKSGLCGNSLIYGFGKIPYLSVQEQINKLIITVIEQKALASDTIWNLFWHTYWPNKSMAEIYALAAVDIAVWDLFTKDKKMALRHLLKEDSINKKVPVYGTTGWLSLSIDELIEECRKYASQGINGFKIRIGGQFDYERVAAVREAMGDDFLLMLDANQHYNVPEAINLAKKMAELNITWLEEPVNGTFQDLQQVNKYSPIPIAAGENNFTKGDFEILCENKIVPILQPDIIRCGGITGFIEIAKMIEKNGIALCNHLLPELSISLISQFSNCYFLEYDNMLPNNIYTQKFIIDNGCMLAPNVPGTGVELTKEAIQMFEITEYEQQ